ATVSERAHGEREYWAHRCLSEVMSGDASLHQRVEQLRDELEAQLRRASSRMDAAEAQAEELRAEVAALARGGGSAPRGGAPAPEAAPGVALQLLRDELGGVQAAQVRMLREVAAVVEGAEQRWGPVRQELSELSARHGATSVELAARLQDVEHRLSRLEGGGAASADGPQGGDRLEALVAQLRARVQALEDAPPAAASLLAEGSLGGQLGRQLYAALPSARDASSAEGLGIELARCIGALDTELRVDMVGRIDRLFRHMRAEVDADVAARATSTEAAVRSVEARLEAKLTHVAEELGARAARADAQLGSLQGSVRAEVDAEVAASTQAAVRSVEARLEAKLSHVAELEAKHSQAAEELGARAAQVEGQLSHAAEELRARASRVEAQVGSLQSSLEAVGRGARAADPRVDTLEKDVRRLEGVCSQVGAMGGRVKALEDAKADRQTTKSMVADCLREITAASPEERGTPEVSPPCFGCSQECP
ncbi:unnamed protein product, partial [Prorocentrum cordatum]